MQNHSRCTSRAFEMLICLRHRLERHARLPSLLDTKRRDIGCFVLDLRLHSAISH
jgi:hypothetical protein